MYGAKILALTLAVENLLESLQSQLPNTPPDIAIITFGGNPVLRRFSYNQNVSDLALQAKGTTNLTQALALAKNIATPQTITLLLSDGAPDDNGFARYKLPGAVFAIAIGYDADYTTLARLVGSPTRVFPASEAQNLPGYLLQNYLTTERSAHETHF